MTLILPPRLPAPSALPVRRHWSARASHLIGPLALAVCAALLWDRLDPGILAQVRTALARMSWTSWAIALPCTALSFWAIGQYDGLMHSLLRTGIPAGRARAAGRRAIALGQAVGFGTLIGALVRWRCLPEMSATALARLSLWVSLSFLAALAVVTGAVGLVVLGGAAGAVLLLGLALLCRRLPLPARLAACGLTGPRLARLLVWTTLDTFFAALVLWAFLPAGLPLGTVFFAYLTALGAGLISQSPGGLGPFELALLWLLPQADPAALIAAALCYRLCYQIGPGLVALALLIRLPASAAPALRVPSAPDTRRTMDIAPHPDWGLTAQGARLLLTPGSTAGWLIRTAPGTLAALGPARGTPPLAALRHHARSHGQTPLLYKCSGREAALARAAGWAVRHIANEAWIPPQRFHLDHPAHRQLRRKLRSAAKSGVTITTPAPLPLARMAALNTAWAQAHGGERGFSMGRFCPSLLSTQWCALAWQDGRLTGFVTFHVAASGWGLDLMRHSHDAAPGTMQSLVCAAIAAARHAGATRLSLAACPVLPALPGLHSSHTAAAGLHQFKSSFAPAWVPRYAAAPSHAHLIRGLAAVTWAIHRPGPDFAFEIPAPSCDALPDGPRVTPPRDPEPKGAT